MREWRNEWLFTALSKAEKFDWKLTLRILKMQRATKIIKMLQFI